MELGEDLLFTQVGNREENGIRKVEEDESYI